MRKFLFLIALSCCFNNVLGQMNIFDASREGNLNTINELVNNNPKIVNSTNENGYSPLVLACYYGHKNVVEFLINKVDDLNTKTTYGSPLMAATVKGYTDIVSLLLINKANPNITDKQGETAAHYAVLFKKYEIIQLLIDANADFTLKNNVGKSPMDYVKAYNDDTINNILKIKK